MFDSRIDGRYGGTGVSFVWQLVEAIAARRAIVISGGLTPANVAACVRAVRPHAVDVRSGIETAGRKDPAKMAAFVRAVREADESAPLAQARGAV
jgi:phosphoribosylanthranilate isomerase